MDGKYPSIHSVVHALQQGVFIVRPAAVCHYACRLVSNRNPSILEHDHSDYGAGFARYRLKKSRLVISRAKASFGSGTMCVAERVTISALLWAK